jgi:hypothetical protein
MCYLLQINQRLLCAKFCRLAGACILVVYLAVTCGAFMAHPKFIVYAEITLIKKTEEKRKRNQSLE